MPDDIECCEFDRRHEDKDEVGASDEPTDIREVICIEVAVDPLVEVLEIRLFLISVRNEFLVLSCILCGVIPERRDHVSDHVVDCVD